MSKASHKDFTCLLNIIDSIEKIKKYSSLFKSADDLFNESKSFDAIMMNFMIIGEISEKLSEDFKSSESHIDWFKIRGFRNIIAHNYFGIDAEEVWQIIVNSLDDLEVNLRKIVDN
jgi:uncharacterized protein with HEPN domain